MAIAPLVGYGLRHAEKNGNSLKTNMELKRNLDKLMEAEFAEAEAAAVLEEREQYGENPLELSLDLKIQPEIVPEDVASLVQMRFEKVVLEDLIQFDQRLLERDCIGNRMVGVLFGSLGGLAAATAIGTTEFLMHTVYGTVLGAVSALAITGLGLMIGVKMDKKQWQERKQSIEKRQAGVAELDQKFSGYHTCFRLDDLVLVREGESIYDQKCSVSYGHDLHSSVDVISVLEPRDYVTREQMKSLEGHTVACYREDGHLFNYGFLQKVSEDEFSLFRDNGYRLKGTLRYEDLQENKICVRLLVPVIKQKLVQGYRVSG